MLQILLGFSKLSVQGTELFSFRSNIVVNLHILHVQTCPTQLDAQFMLSGGFSNKQLYTTYITSLSTNNFPLHYHCSAPVEGHYPPSRAARPTHHIPLYWAHRKYTTRKDSSKCDQWKCSWSSLTSSLLMSI